VRRAAVTAAFSMQGPALGTRGELPTAAIALAGEQGPGSRAELRLAAGQVLDGSVAELAAPDTASDNLLVDVLGAEVDSVRRTLGMPVELVVTGQVTAVRSPVVYQLYRIVQHAITICAERSRASCIWVEVAFGAGDVTVLVQDSGGGLSLAALNRHAHAGLVSIARCAAAAGAAVDFQPLPGLGARLVVRAPLSAPPGPPPPVCRVAVVAAKDISQAGIAGLLAAGSPRVVIVAQVASAAEMERMFPGARPDVTVAQLDLPGHAPESDLGRICAVARTPVLVVGRAASPGVAAGVIRAGASGWLDDTTSGSELAEAVLAAAGGHAILRAADRRQRTGLLAGVRVLTQREQQVLGLVRYGRRDRQIAQNLSISVKTVEKHVGSILRKTGAQNRTELVALVADGTPAIYNAI
jgi:DNA-binding NarL/FixJ family response regulator